MIATRPTQAPFEPMLPQNIEAEFGVLGSIMIDPENMGKVATSLTAADFYREDHAIIYAAIAHLYGMRQPADSIMVINQLEREGNLEKIDGGPGYIVGLIDQVPTSANAEYYAHIVADCALYRRMIRYGSQVVASGYAQEPDALTRAKEGLYEIGQKTDRRVFQSTKALMPGYLDELDFLHEHKGQIVGVPSGYMDLDRATCGFQKSDLIIIAGRPATGKTSLALSMGYNAACSGKKVAMFSLEMGSRQLMRRFMSMASKVDMQRLRTGWIEDDQWETVIEAAGHISALPIYINDTAGNPLTSMEDQLQQLIQDEGQIDEVIVDYLGLVEPEESKNDNRVNEVSKITRGLKRLANKFDVPMVVLSQLSRKVEERKDKHPLLSDLRDSGSVEQDSDVVLMIYRDDYYAQQENRPSEAPGIMEVTIAKQRNGPTGSVSLYFKAEETMVYPLEYRLGGTQ
jgi:replicative DNA helicase